MSGLTPFGKALRKLRIDKELRLFDLAERLGISTSFLSAIETGRKPIPDGFAVKISHAIPLSLEELKELRAAVDKTRKEVNVARLDEDRRHLIAAFARQIDELPDDLIEQIKKKVLESVAGETPFRRKRRGIVVPPRSAVWLRQYAIKVRQVFGCENRFDFPIIEVIEYKFGRLIEDFLFDVQDINEMGKDEGRVPIGKCELILRRDVYDDACRGDGRARFTAGHELLHFMLHRGISFSRARDDSDKIYCDSEWQADEFSGALFFSPLHSIAFAGPYDASVKCGISRSAAEYMWNKYVKAGLINPQSSLF